MSRPQVAVVGAGGIGSKFAALLSQAADVTVLHRDPEFVCRVNGDGLRLIAAGHECSMPVRATLDPADLTDSTLVLFAVKSYDTVTAINQVAPHLHPDAVVFTLQNGLGNTEAIGQVIGDGRVGLAVTTEGATLLEPGVVADKGRGVTHVGAPGAGGDAGQPGGTSGLVAGVVDLLNQAGLSAQLSEDIEGLLWAKLAMVAGVNTVAAVLRLPNGRIGEIPEVRALSLAAIGEVKTVAERLGIRLAFDPAAAFDRVTAATAKMLSGSLIDMMRGRTTEIDAIAGAVARQAAALGVPAPVNTVLAQVVRAMEASAPHRLEPPATEATTR
jgi:2-dehydropantoate 2-reductase